MALNDPEPTLAGGPETQASAPVPEHDKDESGESDPMRFWLARAAAMYAGGRSWFDTNVRPQTERNLDNLAGRHPAGSKYHQKAYLHRSKIFRPRIRSAQRGNEANLVSAVFANRELIQVSPENEDDEQAKAHSEVVSELMKARLERPEMGWYQCVSGACFDAWSQGVVISKQEWLKETIMIPQIRNGQVTLGPDGQVVREPVTKEDRPSVSLIPAELLLFDESANWINPLRSSTYIVELIPMPIVDVKARINASRHAIGHPQPWLPVTSEEMAAAVREDSDPTRQRREGLGRQDPKGGDANRQIPEHRIVWVHLNIERDEWGVDWQWHTIGTDVMLSTPVPVMLLYPHLAPGERPYTMGSSIIEPHRSRPPAMTELAEGLIAAGNEILNSRFDNIRLSINRRFRVRRGANIDLEAMRMSVPGGAYEVEDVRNDVMEEAIHDVTGSAYQESNQLDITQDDLTGTFSGNSVQNNRNLGDTVGGMAMARSASSSANEHQTRTIVVTWAHPCLDQVMRMEQYYETDETLLAVAGKSAKSFRRLYSDEKGRFHPPQGDEWDRILTERLRLRLLIGRDAGDPITRVGNLVMGIEKLVQLPGMALRLNGDEVAKEMFAAIGFDHGSRFLHDDQDERYASLVQNIQQLQQQIDAKQAEGQNKLQIVKVVEESKQAMNAAKIKVQQYIQDSKDAESKEERQLERDTLVWNAYLEEFDRRLKLMEFEREGQVQSPGDQGNSPIAALKGDAGVMARNEFGHVPHSQG